jgi:hypothetical protein
MRMGNMECLARDPPVVHPLFMLRNLLAKNLGLAQFHNFRQFPRECITFLLAEGQSHDIGRREQDSFLDGMPVVFHQRCPVFQLSQAGVDEHQRPDGQVFGDDGSEEALQVMSIRRADRDHVEIFERLNFEGDLSDEAGRTFGIGDEVQIVAAGLSYFTRRQHDPGAENVFAIPAGLVRADSGPIE